MEQIFHRTTHRPKRRTARHRRMALRLPSRPTSAAAMGRMPARHRCSTTRNRRKLLSMAVFRQPFRRTGQQFLPPSRTLYRPENPPRRRRPSEILAQTRTAKPTAARLGVRTHRPIRPPADFRRTPAPRRRARRKATAAPDYHPSHHRPTQPAIRRRT